MLHAAAAADAARAFPRPQTYVTFRTHRTVLHDVALLGVAFRSTRLQHLREKSLIPERPFPRPNFTLRVKAYRAVPNVVVWRGVAWRCVVLRCDQPGCSTFARYRSSLTDLSRPNFILPKELIVRHQAPLRGAVLHSAERELRCARESVYAARAFPLPQIYVAFRTHRTVLRSVVLRGLALRPAGPQQFRAIPFVLNRPFCAPNFALH